MIDDIEETQDEQLEDDQQEDQDAGEDDSKDPEGDIETEDDEIVVTIGDEEIEDDDEPPEGAKEWAIKLRKRFRDKKKEIRELKQQIYEMTSGQREGAAPQAAGDPGPMPTFEECDFDNEKYAEKMQQWKDKFKQHVKKSTEQDVIRQKQDQAWQEKLRHYNHKKKSLKVRDYDDAESNVQDTLSVTQQGMIVQGAENPALLVYALGKNPKLAAELAAITDPISFAFKVAKLETQLKTSKRKAKTKPEKSIRTTGKISGTTDSELSRLRAEAEITHDLSKVNAYKRKLKQRRAG